MASLEKRLREIVAKVLVLEDREVDDRISRRDTETWDSLAHLMLITEVEATFGVTFSDDEIVEISTVGDLKRKLKSLGIET